MSVKLRVVEIFCSIQGEGANQGRLATFVRLANCNMNCSFCDTEWRYGKEMTIDEIKSEVEKHSATMIIWTGGEPTLQLNAEVLQHFSSYYQAIETNGSNPVPQGIDYISCSPKVRTEILRKNFGQVNEIRYPVVHGFVPPPIDDLPPAQHYFLSPVFEGNERECMEMSASNLAYCIELIKQEPRWRLSVQLHKLLGVQ